MRITLADEPSVSIGPLLIEPSRRRVSRDDGRAVVLDPRAMKVLAALLRDAGSVLSRDHLFETCWEGRAVGDEAVDRAVARARRALRDVADGIIEIETVTKVGYRLIAHALPGEALPIETITKVGYRPRLSGSGDGDPPVPTEQGPGEKRPRWPWVTAGALVALSLGGWAAWHSRAAPGIPDVAVKAEEGEDASVIAGTLANDLSRLAAAQPDSFAIVQPTGSQDYLIRIGSERLQGGLRAEVSVAARSDPEILWSGRFERPPGQSGDLRAQIGAEVGSILLCAAEARRSGANLDRAAARLLFQACDQLDAPPSDERRRILLQLVEQAPGFGWGWAMLAMVESEMAVPLLLGPHRADASEGQRLRAAAYTRLEQARRLAPASALTFAVEAQLGLDNEPLEDTLAGVERGIAAHPNHAPLHELRATIMNRVGRGREAVRSARRAVELNPLSALSRSRLINALGYAGNVTAAWRELEASERIWPGAAALRDARFRLAMRVGDAREALRIIDEDETRGIPGDLSWPIERAFLDARLDPSPTKIAAVLRPYREYTRGRNILLPMHLQALVQFGMTDEAYRLTEGGADIATLRGSSDILFRPYMRAFRADPRFIPLVARLGLLRYWRRNGMWPDFCFEPDLPYDCRREAARLPDRN